MIENAIRACPDSLWSRPSEKPAWKKNDVVGFWYVVYHTLFFLDYHLTPSPNEFAPPSPFNLDEMDPAGLLPARPYTKDELLKYLEHCRTKMRGLTDGIDAGTLLYAMRHVQHHAGQLNLLLRQHTGSAPRYVKAARVG